MWIGTFDPFFRYERRGVLLLILSEIEGRWRRTPPVSWSAPRPERQSIRWSALEVEDGDAKRIA